MDFDIDLEMPLIFDFGTPKIDRFELKSDFSLFLGNSLFSRKSTHMAGQKSPKFFILPTLKNWVFKSWVLSGRHFLPDIEMPTARCIEISISKMSKIKTARHDGLWPNAVLEISLLHWVFLESIWAQRSRHGKHDKRKSRNRVTYLAPGTPK